MMRRLLRWTGLVRKRFSKLPHWARDTYGIVSYVNFIELIPTLAAIALAPRHFFRRLPSILDGRRPAYQTPVKFFVGFASLFLTLFYLRHGELTELASQSKAMLWMPALIPATPIVMIALTIVCWLLYQVPRLAPNGDAFPPPNSGPFKMVLNPKSYLNLQYPRFFWGLFYISVYFVAAWQVVQVLVALNFLGVVYLVTEAGDGSIVFKGIMILFAIALVALSIHGLVLHPYMEMFRASLRRPSQAVFEADVDAIRQAVKDFLAATQDESTLATETEKLCSILESEMQSLRRTQTQQDVDYQISAASTSKRTRSLRRALQADTVRARLQAAPHELRQRFEIAVDAMGCHDIASDRSRHATDERQAAA